MKLFDMLDQTHTLDKIMAKLISMKNNLKKKQSQSLTFSPKVKVIAKSKG